MSTLFSKEKERDSTRTVNQPTYPRRTVLATGTAMVALPAISSPTASALSTQAAPQALAFRSSSIALRLARRLVLDEASAALVNNPYGMSEAVWLSMMRTFEESGGLPGTFDRLVRHFIHNPGRSKYTTTTLLNASSEAREVAIRRLAELPTRRLTSDESECPDDALILIVSDGPLDRRLKLLEFLAAVSPHRYRKPIPQASL